MNPWIIVGFLAALIGSFFYGEHVGSAAQDAKWQARENTELKAANQKIIDLTQAARAQEAENAANQAAIAEAYEGKLQNVQNDKDKFVSDVRAGRIVLRIPTAAARNAGRGSTSAPNAAARKCDGPAQGELPREVTEFLFGEASRADAYTEQLTSCQAVVIEMQRSCNKSQD